MTRRSRGIHAAWHFWYAVVFGVESGLRKLGLCGIHPLTQRYIFKVMMWKRKYLEMLLSYWLLVQGYSTF
ncbi:DUF3265 domain-containing protein [Vibrio vulnificus]|nr:DUF3265 domain-containing protein [Vibrio vulnificus]EIH1439287.1 DUF3265 domain-containing protein [Vibrio vulnificus]